jgi:O-acetylhomoserine (thiol)-lyase
MKGFATKAIHGGTTGREAYGALRTPVYDTVAFEHDSARSIQLAFEGKKPAHVYSRITNPTVQDFEQKIRLLSGGTGVLAVASGMAAISNTLFTLAEAGSNIVTTRHLFGNSLSLLEKTFAPWGLEIRFTDMSNPNEVDNTIDSNTRAIFIESITNPQLEVADSLRIGRIAKKHAIPLIMDNTLMTPYLFDTKKAGVDIELLSTTKYISGGATSLGGIIIDNGTFDWRKSPRLTEFAAKAGPMAFIATLRQEVFRNIGACMSPHNAYLQNLGIETMNLRIDKSCENTGIIARYLENHPTVKEVHYPGLPSSQFHPIAKKQFHDKFGGLLTFDLENQADCFTFIDNLQLIKRATNVNDNKTLVLHPFSTIFAEYSKEEKDKMGVRSTMVRLAVGIEDSEDLLDDIEKGLEAL